MAKQMRIGILLKNRTNFEFFINCEKTLSANLQFVADGCAQTKFELVWVAVQP